MAADTLQHDTYNISSGQPAANHEFVTAVNAAVPGAEASLRPGRNPERPPDNFLDITRLQEDTGFEPEYDVGRAVADYAGWLRRHDR